MRRRTRGEASPRVAAAFMRSMFMPIAPAMIPNPAQAEAHPRPPPPEERQADSPGYPVESMGDAE